MLKLLLLTAGAWIAISFAFTWRLAAALGWQSQASAAPANTITDRAVSPPR